MERNHAKSKGVWIRIPKKATGIATLNSTNRYAILWRIQTAKKPQTRGKLIGVFLAMLKKKEKLDP